MPKLKISGALQYLLWFLGRNERNKCGGVPKWIYLVGNLKNKVDCSKRPSEKKIGLEQKQKGKKNEERKEVEVQFELYCVKLVELVLFEKKNCAPLVFRNYIVPYIYLFFIVKPLTLVATLQPC